MAAQGSSTFSSDPKVKEHSFVELVGDWNSEESLVPDDEADASLE